jgi:hypothetical protein
MPTVVPVGVASPSKVRAVDTWLYADGIAVGVAQTAVSLSPSVLMCRRPRHADGRAKPSPYRRTPMAIATPTAMWEEPTGSMPTALRRRQPSAYGCADGIPSYAVGLKPSALLFAAVAKVQTEK